MEGSMNFRSLFALQFYISYKKISQFRAEVM